MADLKVDLSGVKPLLQTLGLGQAPDAAPKNMSAQPPPPMQMPPVPAGAGFSEWASDPQTQQKIASGITAPGTPLLPPQNPASPPALGANVPLPPDAAGLASVNPPKPAPMAFMNPPNAQPAQVPPSAPALAPGGVPPANIAAAPTLPTSAPTPAEAYQTRMRMDEVANPDQYQKPGLVGQGWKGFLKYGIPAALESAGSGLSNMGRGDPTAGMKLIANQTALDRNVPAANAAEYDLRNVKPLRDAAQQQQAAAELEKTKATTANLPMQMQLKRNEEIRKAAEKGQILSYDDDGVASVADDPTSQAYKDRVTLGAMHQSTADKNAALTAIKVNGYKEGTPEYNREMTKVRQADQRLGIAMQGLGLRAEGLQLRKENTAAQNTGIDPETGKPFAGAAQIADDDGNVTPVGSRFAGHAVTANAGASQFNDVHGALDSLEGTAKDLIQSGGKLNSPAISYAMQHSSGTPSQFIQSLDKANLTPQERAYVISAAAAHENIQGLRKSAGGGATDSQVENLLKMLPDGSTPDLNYLLGQTGQIRSTATRLGKGATTAAGGLTVRGQSQAAPAKGDGSAQKFTDAGVVYNIPTKHIAEFKKDHPNAR